MKYELTGSEKKMQFSQVIIEGMDCSGKSTIVERVKNNLRWDSKSLHHIEGDQFRRYLREYAFNDKTVFDRSHFSEIVYSTLWREGNPFSKMEKAILDGYCTSKTLIVFACPELDVMRERYKQRGFEQQIKLSELEKSRKLFYDIFKDIPHLKYRSRDFNELSELVDKIKSVCLGENEIICNTN